MSLRKNPNTKLIVDSVLSFFTALTLFLSGVCILLVLTVCNDSYMLFSIGRSGYQQRNVTELIEELGYISEPMGIEPSLITDAVNPAEIKDNIAKSVKKAYQGEGFSPDSSVFTGRVYNAVSRYAAEHSLQVDSENLEHIIEICANIYTQHSSVSYVATLGHYAAQLRLPFLSAGIVSLAISLFLCRRLWFMHYRKYVTVRFMIYAISAAGLSLIALPVLILTSGWVAKVSISVASLYHLFTTYVNFLLQFFIFTGLFILAIALILLIFYKKYKDGFFFSRR